MGYRGQGTESIGVRVQSLTIGSGLKADFQRVHECACVDIAQSNARACTSCQTNSHVQEGRHRKPHDEACRRGLCGWQDVGMVICESSVVAFLPCLVPFLRFHPYMLFHF